MKCHVPLVVALLPVACGNELTSPSSPRRRQAFPRRRRPAPAHDARPWGVWDTTTLPISGAQVQVIAPTPSTVAVTDGDGQFVLRWPYANARK
jgi:hypothetical protein